MPSQIIKKIKKRDGRIVPFESEKIAIAISKAFLATKQKDGRVARNFAYQVVKILEKRFKRKILSVEDVQDVVEQILIKNNYGEVAKAYILYRAKRSEIRETKKIFGVEERLELSINAVKVLRERYLLKNEKGEVIETPEGMFHRVARAIARVDAKYDKKANVKKIENEFYQAMASLEFLPNTPTLMNAGTKPGQLSACFVISVEDSLKGIMSAVTSMALIHQSGGGTGFSFARLRPRGDIVRLTKGVASGPVSFMRIFDTTTEVVKQGGKRRGANMGILSCDHPDIMEFIIAKKKKGFLSNFNLSVAVTDKFMEAVKKNREYELINPKTKKAVGKLNAKHVFDMMALSAWETGDPGLVFLDEINRHNPTPKAGKMESTNPCGEQPLLPYESCNLGSINLAKFVLGGSIDWEKLGKMVSLAVHFLDNVIDASKFPLKEISKMTLANRKIGLGVMGFAEMLLELKTPYNSKKTLEIAEKLMRFISEKARKKSIKLGKKRGSFPNFKESVWKKGGISALRNSTCTTIAPTGTISIISGTSSGIEPLFAVVFIRNILAGARLLEINPEFERQAREKKFYSKELLGEIAKYGSISRFSKIPENTRRLFVTAMDIDPDFHVKVQAVFQKYTDNAVSKTINLPQDSTVEDVKKAYMLAYKLKCKGITVYRYGSKEDQVLSLGSKIFKEAYEEHISAESEYAGGCPGMVCPF
jgi:ribonucleoside-diphosphate reductase alpha chain